MAGELDLAVALDSFMLDGGQLDALQAILASRAPTWAAGLHVYHYREPKIPVDVGTPGALEQAVRATAFARGPLYYELERRYGPAPFERRFGFVELRGASRALELLLMVDEYVHKPLGAIWSWGNMVMITVRRPRVERQPAGRWAAETFADICAHTTAVHGYGAMEEEYVAKNMAPSSGGGRRAIGLDHSKALPGLYWLNFFGPPYVALLGRERLPTAPAYRVAPAGAGIVLQLAEEPQAWASAAYREREGAVLAHLGPAYFFDRRDPDRPTVAPAFGLPRIIPGEAIRDLRGVLDVKTGRFRDPPLERPPE